MRTEQEIKDKIEEIWQAYLNDFTYDMMPRHDRFIVAMNVLKWVLKEI